MYCICVLHVEALHPCNVFWSVLHLCTVSWSVLHLCTACWGTTSVYCILKCIAFWMMWEGDTKTTTTKNLLEAHHFFDQSTLEMFTYMSLSVECTKCLKTMQKQHPTCTLCVWYACGICVLVYVRWTQCVSWLRISREQFCCRLVQPVVTSDYTTHILSETVHCTWNNLFQRENKTRHRSSRGNAVCCRVFNTVLQCVAVCRSVLQCVAKESSLYRYRAVKTRTGWQDTWDAISL